MLLYRRFINNSKLIFDFINFQSKYSLSPQFHVKYHVSICFTKLKRKKKKRLIDGVSIDEKRKTMILFSNILL